MGVYCIFCALFSGEHNTNIDFVRGGDDATLADVRSDWGLCCAVWLVQCAAAAAVDRPLQCLQARPAGARKLSKLGLRLAVAGRVEVAPLTEANTRTGGCGGLQPCVLTVSR